VLPAEIPHTFTIISQDGTFKIFWDLLCMIIILYEIIAIPFSISFDVIISSELDLLVDVVFIFDIVLNFNTSFYQKGVPIYSRTKIMKHYLKMWFWVDILASFPYS
jgi:hyperpolarization activated cyclic nucleotide-gated potassium channel 2